MLFTRKTTKNHFSCQKNLLLEWQQLISKLQTITTCILYYKCAVFCFFIVLVFVAYYYCCSVIIVSFFIVCYFFFCSVFVYFSLLFKTIVDCFCAQFLFTVIVSVFITYYFFCSLCLFFFIVSDSIVYCFFLLSSCLHYCFRVYSKLLVYLSLLFSFFFFFLFRPLFIFLSCCSHCLLFLFDSVFIVPLFMTYSKNSSFVDDVLINFTTEPCG